MKGTTRGRPTPIYRPRRLPSSSMQGASPAILTKAEKTFLNPTFCHMLYFDSAMVPILFVPFTGVCK